MFIKLNTIKTQDIKKRDSLMTASLYVYWNGVMPSYFLMT